MAFCVSLGSVGEVWEWGWEGSEDPGLKVRGCSDAAHCVPFSFLSVERRDNEIALSQLRDRSG